MLGKTEPKKIALIESIKHKTRVLPWMAVLIVFTILFVNVKVISTVLDYIPSVAVLALLSIASVLVIIGFYLAIKISLSAIHSLVEYSNEINNLLSLKDKEITERKKMEEALKKASDDWQITFDSTKDIMMMLDREFKITKVNRATAYLMNKTFQEILGTACYQFFNDIGLSIHLSPLESMRKTRSHVEKEVRLSSGIWMMVSADPILDDKGDISGAVLILRDVTEHRRAEEKIHSLAYYDTLTGLPNRVFCMELIARAIALARRYNRKLATLFIDLDFFQRLNDTLGHEAGDQLLQAVSDRLQKYLRKSDYIAYLDEDEMTEAVSRLGGDEYIVLLNEIEHPNDAAKVANRILKDISQPFKLNTHDGYITASIGISVYPFDGEDAESLLRNADIAMYHTKKQGGNNFQFYSESMNVNALRRLTIENNLRKALERNEFLLYYQPKLDVKDRRISGMEALIRWNHHEMGLISTAEFIPLAEDTGLIIPIGKWVLRTACLQNKAWQKAGCDSMKVSVNISARQFEQQELLENITRVLREADLDPEYLELEITESTVMKNPEYAIATLQELKATGIKISIDDFGTGYSSLNYLRQLPLDALKIDRSFVSNALTRTSDRAIISAIISLAHNLKLTVIAEGVEREEQLAFLSELQCDEAQGYLFSWPLPADECTQLLKLAKQT